MLEWGVPVGAQVRTASPRVAADCMQVPYYVAPAVAQRSLFFLCRGAECQLYLCSDPVGQRVGPMCAGSVLPVRMLDFVQRDGIETAESQLHPHGVGHGVHRPVAGTASRPDGFEDSVVTICGTGERRGLSEPVCGLPRAA